MQGLVEKTEACLTGIQKKSQVLFESMAEALEKAPPRLGVDKFSELLELNLQRMQQELSSNGRGQESNITKVRDGQEATAFAALLSTPTPLISDIEREAGEQPLANEKQISGAQVVPSFAPIDARLLALEESVHSLRRTTTSQLGKNEGLSTNAPADEGLSMVAVDKFSETLQRELRMMKQELLCCVGHETSFIPKSELEVVTGIEAEPDVAGASVLATQIRVDLRAIEESIHGLQQKAEVMLGKIDGLLWPS